MDRAHIHHYVFEAYGTGGRPLAFPFFLSFPLFLVEKEKLLITIFSEY
jgi:hypothetical protein